MCFPCRLPGRPQETFQGIDYPESHLDDVGSWLKKMMMERISCYDQMHFSGRGLDDADCWKDYFGYQTYPLLCSDDKHLDQHRVILLLKQPFEIYADCCFYFYFLDVLFDWMIAAFDHFERLDTFAYQKQRTRPLLET